MHQTPEQPGPMAARKESPPPAFAILHYLQGQWIARCVHVATHLGLADLLKDGPRHIDKIAAITNTHAPSLYRLFRCLASLGIFVECEPNTFAQTELSEALCSGQPGSIYALAKLYGRAWQWDLWGHLEDSIRTGKSAFSAVYNMTIWEYLQTHPEEGALYDEALASASRVINASIIRSYDFSAFQTIVDVGGGQGDLLAAILTAAPQARGILFDQAAVIKRAEAQIEPALRQRMQFVAGDFFTAIPQGGDAYLFKQVLHDWDDEASRKILTTCRQAMHPGSKLLIADLIVQPGGGSETTAAKLTDLVMLVIQGGRERTAEEFAQLFAASGFQLTRIIATGVLHSIIEGVPI
jgi:ubiquinone/menaquinone biosynthesis C-methylase UbiE